MTRARQADIPHALRALLLPNPPKASRFASAVLSRFTTRSKTTALRKARKSRTRLEFGEGGTDEAKEVVKQEGAKDEQGHNDDNGGDGVG